MITTISTLPNLVDWTPEYLDLETTERSHLNTINNLETTLPNTSEPTLTDCKQTQPIIPIRPKLKINFAEEIFYEYIPSPKYDPLKRDRLLSLASGESNVTSEDLIINENIDFFYEEESKGKISGSISPSFNYTKSDQSISECNSPQLLTQSFLGSHDESRVGFGKSFDTQDPALCADKMQSVSGWQECKEQSRIEKEKIIQEIKIFLDIGKALENQDSSILFENEENAIKNEENNSKGRCGCSSCYVF